MRREEDLRIEARIQRAERGRFTDDLLDRMRMVGDPMADEAIGELRAQGSRSRDILADLRRQAQRSPGPCRRLWRSVHQLPDWADFAQLRASNELSLQNALPGGLVLLGASLVESYSNARGAKVLVRTGRLEKDTLRRLYETAQFVSDIALAAGPRPGSRAFDQVLKVRLVHAWVRRAMRDRPDWDEAWGLPINQEDQAWTLLMFSHVFRRGLLALGVEMDETLRDGSHATWRLVGWLLGIDEQLLSVDRREERQLYAAIARRQSMQPDADSHLLTHQLIRATAMQPPFFLPQAGLYAVSRRMIGPEQAQRLSYPLTPRWDRLLASARQPLVLQQLLMQRSDTASRLLLGVGKRITHRILAHGLGSRPAGFQPGETSKAS